MITVDLETIHKEILKTWENPILIVFPNGNGQIQSQVDGELLYAFSSIAELERDLKPYEQ
jgi:hypothetical protein